MVISTILAFALLASPSPPPAWPYNVARDPKCMESALSANDELKVYEARRDWERLISASTAAAKKQAQCADETTANRYGQYALRMLAATTYSRAADVAMQEKDYSIISGLVAEANRIYGLMLEHPNPIYGTEQNAFIRANIIANDDLLSRIPKPKKP